MVLTFQTKIPIIAGGQVTAGSLSIRFLLESLDLDNLVRCDFLCTDIAIAGLRARRLDTDRHDLPGSADCLYGLADDPGEFLRLQDQGVRRGHDHIRIRIPEGNLPARIGDAGGRIAPDRLGQDLVGRDIRQLLPDDIDIFLRSDNPKMVGLADREETVHGQLDQGPSDAQYIDELLGHQRRTDRPEPASYAAGHDDNVCIHNQQFSQI